MSCDLLSAVDTADGPSGVAGRGHSDLLLSVSGLRRTHRLLQLQPQKVRVSNQCFISS